VCKELLYQTRAARVIDLSPNGCDVLLGAIELRLFTIVVAKTEEHVQAP
jgi:hypothetical protein